MSEPTDIPDNIDPDVDPSDVAMQAIAMSPVNPFNQTLQPVPLASKKGLIDSNQGPAGALTIMHPAGEFTMISQDPGDLKNLAAEINQLATDLEMAQLRHQLTNPTGGGLVIPTPKIPGVNGAKLL